MPAKPDPFTPVLGDRRGPMPGGSEPADELAAVPTAESGPRWWLDSREVKPGTGPGLNPLRLWLQACHAAGRNRMEIRCALGPGLVDVEPWTVETWHEGGQRLRLRTIDALERDYLVKAWPAELWEHCYEGDVHHARVGRLA